MAIITSLSQKDALPYFRRMVAEAWSDQQEAPNFLRSLTTKKKTNKKAVSIEVQRNFRKIAAEVVRGGSPNLHRGDKSTGKDFIPPYYSDAVILNDQDVYARVFGDGSGVEQAVSRSDIRELAMYAIDKMIAIRREQERAVEKQISDILNTGIVNTLEGPIDYKRKSESIITNTGGDLWSDVSADALGHLFADAKFIAQQGNSGSGRFNVICGDDAQIALFNNTKLKEEGNLRFIQLVDLGMPKIQANGATLHGMVSSGSYKFFIWTYAQYYDLGTKTGDLKDTGAFIPSDSYYMLSEDVDLRYWKAGLPTVFGQKNRILGNIPVFSDGWSVHESISERQQTHEAIVRVAPLVVPYSVDRFIKRKVL